MPAGLGLESEGEDDREGITEQGKLPSEQPCAMDVEAENGDGKGSCEEESCGCDVESEGGEEGMTDVKGAADDTQAKQLTDQTSAKEQLRAAPAMIAFDGMLVQLSVLPHLPLVAPLVSRVLRRYEQLQEAQHAAEEQARFSDLT